MGALRAQFQGMKRFKKSVWFGKTMKNVSGDLGSLFKGVHQSIIGFLALFPMALGHKINRRFFIKKISDP